MALTHRNVRCLGFFAPRRNCGARDAGLSGGAGRGIITRATLTGATVPVIGGIWREIFSN